jgi:hypothetical protein
MNKLDELLQQYAKRFNENFPVFSMMSLPETDMVTLIERCLATNTPHKAIYKEDAEY